MLRSIVNTRNQILARNVRAMGGHAAPEAPVAAGEAWYVALEKHPKGQVILGSICAACLTSGVILTVMMANGEKVRTMNSDWVEANKDYMRFQKMNPISGISSKK